MDVTCCYKETYTYYDEQDWLRGEELEVRLFEARISAYRYLWARFGAKSYCFEREFAYCISDKFAPVLPVYDLMTLVETCRPVDRPVAVHRPAMPWKGPIDFQTKAAGPSREASPVSEERATVEAWNWHISRLPSIMKGGPPDRTKKFADVWFLFTG